MIILRTGMIPTGKWHCDNCACANDAETDRCWNCNADMDGTIEPEEATNAD